NAEYYVDGSGIRKSNYFSLPGFGKAATLDVTTGSSAGAVSGVLLLSVGAGLLAGGVVITVLLDDYRAYGGTMIGVGGAMLITGGILEGVCKTHVKIRGRELAHQGVARPQFASAGFSVRASAVSAGLSFSF
ncbi:MAG TPA: hypothetical protein PKI03_39920, partial [Pseudomonadota bacterium]|nr:hypothetical protein [Pseudomonadota bacterium]